MAEKRLKQPGWEFTEGRKNSLRVAQQIHVAVTHVGLNHPKEVKKEMRRLARIKRQSSKQ